MSRFATISLEVTVELETEPGINTPDGHELPYDYLAIRDVSYSSVMLHGNPGALALLDGDSLDELDPDSLLSSGAKDALYGLMGSTELRDATAEESVPDSTLELRIT